MFMVSYLASNFSHASFNPRSEFFSRKYVDELRQYHAILKKNYLDRRKKTSFTSGHTWPILIFKVHVPWSFVLCLKRMSKFKENKTLTRKLQKFI